MLIFVIVGTVSAYGFRLTRQLEEIGHMTVTTEPVATPPKHSAAGDLKAERMPFGRWMRLVGWRHVVAIVMVVWALFPVFYVISLSFSGGKTLTVGLLAGPQRVPGAHLPGAAQARLQQLPDAADQRPVPVRDLDQEHASSSRR